MIRAARIWWMGVSTMALVVSSQTGWAQGAAPRPARPAARQAARPAARQATRPAARQAARPAPRQAARPAARQAARPTPVRAAKPAGCSPQDAKRLRALVIRAASEYDGYDYESAKASLNDAIAIAEGKGCAKNPDALRAYLYLGVVYVAGYRDMAAGKKAWFKALALDPSVTVPRRMATPRLLRAFAAVKAQYKVQAPARAAGPGTGPGKPAPRPLGPPKGLEHNPVTEAVEAKPLTITCRTGDELQAAKVVLYYKPSFGVSYRELAMTKAGRWEWKADVPGKFVIGKALRYFMVVYDAQGRPVAASGNAASPHVATIKAEEASAGTQEENPLGPGGGTERPRFVRHETPEPDQVEVPGGHKKARKTRRHSQGAYGPVTSHVAMFRVSAGLGGGFGLLNGVTEVARKGYDYSVYEDLPTAMSSGSLYGQFGLGYLMNPNMVLSVVGRIGKMFISKEVLDAGAGNSYDWLVLLRFRYQSAALSTGLDWLGWRWFAGGGLGYGIIRHHIKAKDVQVVEGERVDVTDTDLAKGVVPDLFGGAELVFLDGYLNLFLEVNYLAAFSGDPDNNLYLHLDFTMGLSTQF